MQPKRKLILTNSQCAGDVVMLTAAVRDLHRCYPGQFLTDVRTGSADLWANNPWLTPLMIDDPDAQIVECHYPLIQSSNQRPVHFLNGFIEYLNQQLGLQITLTDLKGDIRLSETEKSAPSPVFERTGIDAPYWIMVAGGKFDFTIKWWHFRRWQAVVDHFQGRLLFAQIGERHHYHPTLNGVLDLRGQTPLRELVRLVYHAEGVVCPVTFLMHLAAAVECRPGLPPNRPCVVVAGGREPASWEAYPTHHFLHTIGMLPCCAEGGCWRARSVPLGDGDEKDEPKYLCVDVIENLPRCMHLITPQHVIRSINSCTKKSSSCLLSPAQSIRMSPFLSRRTEVGRTQFRNHLKRPRGLHFNPKLKPKLTKTKRHICQQ
jgi:ADP-heptose:LPS heptosyltransferase